MIRGSTAYLSRVRRVQFFAWDDTEDVALEHGIVFLSSHVEFAMRILEGSELLTNASCKLKSRPLMVCCLAGRVLSDRALARLEIATNLPDHVQYYPSQWRSHTLAADGQYLEIHL
jgi:hypothetical protein